MEDSLDDNEKIIISIYIKNDPESVKAKFICEQTLAILR